MVVFDFHRFVTTTASSGVSFSFKGFDKKINKEEIPVPLALILKQYPRGNVMLRLLLYRYNNTLQRVFREQLSRTRLKFSPGPEFFARVRSKHARRFLVVWSSVDGEGGGTAVAK